MSLASLPRHVFNNLLIEPNTGHWFWLGYVSPNGYGRVSINNRQEYVHRYIYSQLVGPIPTGMVLDHICRVRRCGAPSHLRVVTRRQNTLENSLGRGAIRSVWTHCMNGHLLDDQNTLRTHQGQARRCRTCHNAYTRNYIAARRQAATAPRAGAG